MIYRQSNGKAEKFFCVLQEVEVLRELEILVSGGFISELPLAISLHELPSVNCDRERVRCDGIPHDKGSNAPNPI